MASSHPIDDPNEPKIRFYNPYLDPQNPNLDLQSLYQPQLLFPEHSLRSFTETLTFYTGSAYLTGTLAGACKGFLDGANAAEYGDTVKLRVNRILNSSGQAGRRIGNGAGLIGLIYAGFERAVFGFRAEDDGVNGVVAGVATGVFYRSAAGPRSAVVGGVVGGVVAAAREAAKVYGRIDMSIKGLL